MWIQFMQYLANKLVESALLTNLDTANDPSIQVPKININTSLLVIRRRNGLHNHLKKEVTEPSVVLLSLSPPALQVFRQASTTS